jgi:SAM-dependent MidA family methyltransferase
MAAANAHYYATRDPLGAEGDFTTAPEISQMFGELIGLWLADLWARAGKPAGPALCRARAGARHAGRRCAAGDARGRARAAGRAGGDQPGARAAQRACCRRALARCGGDAARRRALADRRERIFRRAAGAAMGEGEDGWRELVVAARARASAASRAACEPPAFAPAEAQEGTIVEARPPPTRPCGRWRGGCGRAGGAALIVDYGHHRHASGDTLQAVSRHERADPWGEPGARDLTAHVDFQALCKAARDEGVRLFGPGGQGAWLRAMGLDLRAASLAKAAPARTEEIVLARERLTAPEQMGSLFKVLALVAPSWPAPEGF